MGGVCSRRAPGFGIVTKYGHMSERGVTGAQRVKRGGVMGYLGSTGARQ